MAKLNQIIALVSSKKPRCQAVLTEVYKTLQKVDLFSGLQRNYAPLDEEGEKLPAENKLVQQTVTGQLDKAKAALVEVIDIVATQENGNCEAVADIKVGDKVLATAVPVTTLLFLEKKVDEIKAMISAIPVLSPEIRWNASMGTGYVSDDVVTHRTKKVPKAFVKAPATDKHPAQVDVFTEDVIVGHWHKVDLSSAIPLKEREEMLVRVEQLREAIKVAREEANSITVPDVKIGDPLTSFVFGR
jgi:hypothetical protein